MTHTVQPLPITTPAASYSPNAMKVVRSKRFEKSLRSFISSKGERWENNSAKCWAADMLADMRHFCDVHGLNYEDIQRLAGNHHSTECADDEGTLEMRVIQSLPPISPH